MEESKIYQFKTQSGTALYFIESNETNYSNLSIQYEEYNLNAALELYQLKELKDLISKEIKRITKIEAKK